VSVHSFGKLIGESGPDKISSHLEYLARRSDVSVKLDVLDPDDELTLEESSWLREQGLIFNLFTPGDSDIITIYNETFTAGTRAMEEVLGRPSLFGSWEQVEGLTLPSQVHNSMHATRPGAVRCGSVQV
jgi:hypothetical protein